MECSVIETSGMPHLTVVGKTIPETWEKAVLEVWEKGEQVKTEYDKPGDPPSRDCSLTLVVQEPMTEPRLHRGFPGGLEELYIYGQEVINGVHDHWIDPQAGKWSYTYHQRFTAWPDGKVGSFDQVNGYIVRKLARTPFTRRAYAITAYPPVDSSVDDPPCLQRIWFRITKKPGEVYYLNSHTHMRSWDIFKAGFMNAWAWTEWFDVIWKEVVALRQQIAERGEISKEEARMPIIMGPWKHFVDSAHIYGCDFSDPQKSVSLQSFLALGQKRSFEQRTWKTDDEVVQIAFQAAQEQLGKEKTRPIAER